MDALAPWNTHWTTGQISPLLPAFPEPRASVPYWVRDLLDPPGLQWTVVAGPRQVGKTTGLGHVVRRLIAADIPPKSIAVVPLDQPSVQDDVGSDLDRLVADLSRLHTPTAGQPLILLLDEIQELPDWSKRLKAAWDRHHRTVRVLGTGSSALKLIRPVEADFPGRVRQQTIHTMKFREVVERHPGRLEHATQQDWDEVTRLAKHARSLLADPSNDAEFRQSLATLHEYLGGPDRPLTPFVRHVFQEYVVWGGYPRVRPGGSVSPAARREAFDQGWNAVLARDVPAVGVAKTREFSLLFRHLAANPGGKFVAAAVAQSLGVKHTTVSEWKRVLEDAFLVQQLMPLKPNLRPTKAKDKAYLLDPGWYAHFRGLTDASDVVDDSAFGLLVENVLIDHARRLQFNVTGSRTMLIGYVDHPEVDVAADLGRRWLLLEAKYRKNPKRSLPERGGQGVPLRVVATRDHFELPEGEGPLYVPAQEWALIA